MHKAQSTIAADSSRFKVISAGRRFGKGILGVSRGLKFAIEGKKCRWVSPSYASDSFQAGWSVACKLANQWPGLATIHQQRRMISFENIKSGGWFQFKTAEEPDGLRGEGIDFVIFDEAAHIGNLRDIWELCVRPSLMDRRGAAWWISTPRGFNYFQELFKRGELGEDGWKSFTFSTYSNPTIPRDEIEALRRDMPMLVARQEIDAEFVQLAGALFSRDKVELVERAPEGLDWVRPWDLAFTTKQSSDFTASARIAMDSEGTVFVDDIVNQRLEWPDVVRLIHNTARLDGGAVRQGIECVAAQVGVLQTLMRDPSLANISLEPVEVLNDKLTRALPAVARCEQGKLKVVRCAKAKEFIDQLCAFPASDHDDMVDVVSAGLAMLAAGAALRPEDIDRIVVEQPDISIDEEPLQFQ